MIIGSEKHNQWTGETTEPFMAFSFFIIFYYYIFTTLLCSPLASDILIWKYGEEILNLQN